MGKIAIKGHATRGKEVIEILEMLGGKISNECGYEDGFYSNYAYFIDTNENYFIDGFLICDKNPTEFSIFTLEDFLEKFPYKVGDKVKIKETGKDVIIEGMSWRNDNKVIYDTCYNNDCVSFYSAEELQPYKEETMKDYLITEEDYEKTLEVEQEYIDAAERLINQLADSTHWKCKDFDSQKMIALFLKKNTGIITEKENSIIVDIPKGYEFAEVDDVNQQVVFEKIGCKYPKTYEECCKILDWNHRDYDRVGYNSELLCKFQVLLLCRDAYWKIAGEQMGLDEPWEPKWEIDNVKYSILVVENEIRIGDNEEIQRLLVFPTEEMRDAFLENFKELIDFCKELL
jgi:hypothetical protein